MKEIPHEHWWQTLLLPFKQTQHRHTAHDPWIAHLEASNSERWLESRRIQSSQPPTKVVPAAPPPIWAYCIHRDRRWRWGTRCQAVSTAGISFCWASNNSLGISGSSRPLRSAKRTNSAQPVSASIHNNCTLRYTSHTESAGLINQRAIATTITLTAAVITSRCSSTWRLSRRQRKTV